MTETATDLDVLFPGEDVPVNGDQIKVMPFFAPQLKTAAALVKPVAVALTNSGLMQIDRVGEKVDVRLAADWPVRVFDVLDATDDLIKFVAFAIGKPVKWFDRVLPDALIDLTTAVFRQNADFFKRRILPKLQAWVPALPGPAPTGEPSTVDSSPPATAESPSTE